MVYRRGVLEHQSKAVWGIPPKGGDDMKMKLIIKLALALAELAQALADLIRAVIELILLLARA
jgi:hypothetical protein